MWALRVRDLFIFFLGLYDICYAFCKKYTTGILLETLVTFKKHTCDVHDPRLGFGNSAAWRSQKVGGLSELLVFFMDMYWVVPPPSNSGK